jgi:hypothetical protein
MKRRDPRPYVGLHKEVIFGCPEWAALSPRAKCLYLILKGKRNPNKNGGQVRLSYRELIKLGHSGLRRPEMISIVFRELERNGWIARADDGGLFGKTSSYTLSGKWDEYGTRS